MKRFRALRIAVWSGLTLLTLAPLGCAQIAGLTGDYELASAGAGVGGRTGAAGADTSAGTAGRSSPQAGSTNTEAGASGADAGAGGEANPSGGDPGSGGGTVGGAGQAGQPGQAGAAGAAGTVGAGPTRLGFSEFHDSAGGGDDASASLADATFAKPAGTRAGDFILVFFGSDHSLMKLSGNELGNAGWTLLEQHHDYGTDGQATYLIYKIAGSNEPDPIVFSGINPAGGGNGVQGLLSVYRGVNALKPVNRYEVNVVIKGTSTTDFDTPTPAITTTVPNCLLIAGLSPDTTVDKPVIKVWPAGFTENQVSVVNPSTPHPEGWANIYSAERHVAAAGTLAASSFGWASTTGTDYYGSLAFVLALAP